MTRRTIGVAEEYEVLAAPSSLVLDAKFVEPVVVVVVEVVAGGSSRALSSGIDPPFMHTQHTITYGDNM